MTSQLVIVGTRRGIYAVHRNWIDRDAPSDRRSIDRWRKAGALKAPAKGGYLIDLAGTRHLVPGYNPDLYVEDIAA